MITAFPIENQSSRWIPSGASLILETAVSAAREVVHYGIVETIRVHIRDEGDVPLLEPNRFRVN